MFEPVSSAFSYMNQWVTAPSSQPGAITNTHNKLQQMDTLNLTGTGLTVEEQAHQPQPKLIHLSQHMEHEHPDLSINSEIHLHISLYG